MTSFEQAFSGATGNDPFPWQRRMALEGARSPALVSVPTGLGKTEGVILGWLWRRRFAAPEVRDATPRRLVYCLPMRVLVEQTRDKAVAWLRKLDLLAEKAPGEHPADRVSVHVLMGGDLEVDWDHWPERDQILIGTQDMLLSRALNRGYAMSRFRWPVHFALLNNDCQWVMDEVQLMGNGLATTTQLQAFRRLMGTLGPVRSTWMSATMRPEWLATVDFDSAEDAPVILELDDEDRVHPTVRSRLEAHKNLEKAGCVASADGRKEADLVIEKHQPGTRTLVVVNTVRRARAIHSALAKLERRAELLLIHSHFRPRDRQAVVERLLAQPGDEGIIAISTQVVEAGVDVSARTLITDVAPWSSLVQRFGRCNRRGDEPEAAVFWIDEDPEKKGGAAPYRKEEIDEARKRLADLTAAGPAHLGEVSGSLSCSHVLRRRDLVDLFDTTPDLAGADIDVSRFIRETDDRNVQVFWREIEEEPLASEEGPARSELCSVAIGELVAWRKAKGKGRSAWRWDHLAERWVEPDSLFPGLVLMLRARDGGYRPETGWDGRAERTDTVAEAEHQDANDRDHLVSGRAWQTVAAHTDRVVRALADLLVSVPGLDEATRGLLVQAARWHDAGKAHEIFQAAVPDGEPATAIWAKTLPKMRRYSRPGFRHELASALAMLRHGLSDLAAYLAAAHHGKVRLSIRSLPHEKRPPEIERRFARGIWDGDALPVVGLGGNTTMPETVLALSYMELGDDEETGPSWLARMLALRDEHGPFRLALLESLLRVADWRASQGAEVPR